MSQAANYTATKAIVDGIEVVRLTDAARHAQVTIAPTIGNMAYEFSINGKNVFFAPFDSPASWKAKPTMAGNPFLAPWANRLDQEAFYANGKKYVLNPALDNFRSDQNRSPIHGLLVYSQDWEVVEVRADARSAHVTSRLDFWKFPGYMAQFPFAHTIEMTYRLKDGDLEVETVLRNHSKEPMPVAIGYHPYFRLHDATRDGWKVHLAAREHLMLSAKLIPTGEIKPVTFPDPLPLQGNKLDDVFSGLVRGSDGRAEFSVQGVNEKLSVIYGPKYTVAVVYSPPGRDFICFEPMAAITNAFNLAQAGTYKDLQSVPPGGVWKESFWIVPRGF